MTQLQKQGAAAKAASYVLSTAGTALKNRALEAIANILTERQGEWLAANAQDVAAAKEAGMVPAMLDRLLKGTVDGIVINRETVEVYTSQYEELTGLTFEEGEGFELDFSGICVGVRKGDTELLEAVNAALDEISEADRTALFDAAMERGGA